DARKTIKNGKNRQFFQGLCTNPGITYTVGYVAKIYSEWPQVTFAALRFLTKAQNPAPAISCKMKNAKGALGALKQTTV
ncbi:MAG: hypothetical protein GY832_08530, partial [Chloroflexi bacterium]|nr:hypothetical protein [Chloroflexota bacterium]